MHGQDGIYPGRSPMRELDHLRQLLADHWIGDARAGWRFTRAAHRLGPSECFEPRWAGGLQPRWACHWIGDARTIWDRAFTASRKLAPSRLMMKISKRKPFPHHYDLLANQRWGYHSADAKWIELWVHDSCSNQPAEWTQWHVWWRYNPSPHRRGSRWTTPPIELDDPDLRVVWWWSRYA